MIKNLEEEMAEFCDNLKPERFAFLGQLHTVDDGKNLFGFLVKSSLVANREKYLPKTELLDDHAIPLAKGRRPQLYRDTVLAIFRENRTLQAREILAVVTQEAAIQINPLLRNGNICLEVSCECPPTLWESRMIIPKDIASYEALGEIILI
jgi:hypothetical protein